MSTEITDQLVSYFAWVEREVGYPLRPLPSPAGLVANDGETAGDDADDRARARDSDGANPFDPCRGEGRSGPVGEQRRWSTMIALIAAAAIIAVLVVVRHGSSGSVDPAGSLPWLSGPVPSDATVVSVGVGTTAPPTIVPAPTAPAPTAPAMIVPDAQRSVISTLALGDSVMLGALSALSDAGINVDAEASIQAEDVIAKLTADLQVYDVVDAVVIHVGTNGPVTAEQYGRLADLVAAVPHVFFLTIKAPKYWATDNNVIINSLPATHPNVSIIDWSTAGQQIEGELSGPDGGVHLSSSSAVRFYSNLILGALGKPQIPNP